LKSKIKIFKPQLLLIIILTFSYAQENIRNEIKILTNPKFSGIDTISTSHIINYLDNLEINTELYARMLTKIGFNYIKLKMFEEAEIYIRKAIYHNQMFPDQLIADYHNLMSVKIAYGQIDSALFYHKKSFEDPQNILIEHFRECDFIKSLSKEDHSKFLDYARSRIDNGRGWSLWQEGRQYQKQGEYKKSDKAYNKAIKFEKNNLDQSSIIDIYYTSKYLNYDDWGKYDKIKDSLEEHLLHISKSPAYSRYKEAYGLVILILHSNNIGTGNIKVMVEVENYYNEAIKNALHLQDYKYIIDSYMSLGSMFWNYDNRYPENNQKSINYFQQALMYARYFSDYSKNTPTLYEDNYFAPIGEIYLEIAKSNMSFKKFDTAFTYYDSAEYHIELTDNDSLKRELYSDISMASYNSNDITNMTKYLDKSIEICKGMTCDEEDIYWNYITVSLTYLMSTDFVKLLELSNNQLNVNNYKNLGDYTLGTGKLFSTLLSGISYCMLGEKDLCNETFNKAYEFEEILINADYEFLNSKEDKLVQLESVNFFFGMAEFFKQDFNKAVSRFEKIVKNKKDYGYKVHTVNILTQSYLALNQIKKAAKNHNKYAKDQLKRPDLQLVWYNAFIQNGLQIMANTGNYKELDAYSNLLQTTLSDYFKTSGKINNKFKDMLNPNFETAAVLQIENGNYLKGTELLELSKAQNFKYRMSIKYDKSGNLDYKVKIPDKTIFVGMDILNELSSPAGKAMKNMDWGKGTFAAGYLEEDYDMFFPQFYEPEITIRLSKREGEYYLEKKNPILTKEYENINNAISIYNYNIKNKIESGSLSKQIYNYIIYPYKDKIENFDNVVFMPDNNFYELPFETLIDNNGQYLIEKYNIYYNQSLDTYSLLPNNKSNSSDNRLLAFADPTYSSDIELDNVSSDIYRSEYLSLGYEGWSDLPGTRIEMESISKNITDSKIYYGDNASESSLKELSKSGRIAEYNIVHFATHGLLVTDKPELNALILSQNDIPSEDGYLRSEEIEELDLDVDLVILSACETAVGESFYSEGIVGLTNSFFIAGAKSVISTLWPIDDEATAIFMNSFYRNINDTDNTVLALANTKREFIRGDHGDEYKKPYFWAPFIYYGK